LTGLSLASFFSATPQGTRGVSAVIGP